MNKPEKLILDYSKWRCGGEGPHKVGEGSVALLNKEGFMCCLGQWANQLDTPDDKLLNVGEPHETGKLIPLLCHQKYELSWDDNGIRSTSLSNSAIGINDNEETTPEEKINQLTILLLNENVQLEVINKP